MSQGSKLFSDKLDRVTFSAYFLGAVVPLLALAVVVQRFALPTLSDTLQSLALIAVVLSTSVLSLGSFLVLRRTTRKSLSQMDRDNHRLSSLLRVSSRLASVQHVTEATETTAECAVELTPATAAFVFSRGVDEDDVTMTGAAGNDALKLYERLDGSLLPIAKLSMEGARPVTQGRSEAGGFRAVAVPLPAEASAIGALVAVRTESDSDFTVAETDALSTLGALAAVALLNGDLRDAQRNFFAHVTDIIVTALDGHLGFLEGHGNRVAQLANRMGRAIGLDEETLHRLHFAALLHDIGMLKLDRSQQMNPKTCDKHALLGSRMLTPIRVWKEIAPIVLHHHEWFDGSGYPEGTAGANIPLEARIISVCDAYDCMTSDASYRAPMAPQEALEELEACAGTQFDPELVATFRSLMESGSL